MVKLDLLDENLIVIIDTVLQNDNIRRYIANDHDDPFVLKDGSPSPIPMADQLLFDRVFPYPYDPGIEEKDQTQLRIYYSEGQINETAVEEILVYFDVIVAKENLWLINRAGKKQFRPYRIMSEIVNMFNRKSIGTVGQLEFSAFSHRYVNEKFDAIQIVAKMTNFTNG